MTNSRNSEQIERLKGIQTRDAALTTRLDDPETRTVEGVAVPINEWQELWPGFYERFAEGAIEPDPHGVKLRLEHVETIGVITDLSSSPEAVTFKARISETRSGNDAHQLALDGALSSASIGFKSDHSTMTITSDEDGNTYVTHNRAELLEISLVSFPAYDSANLTNVRNESRKDPTMSDTTALAEDVAAVRGSLEELQRRFALFSDQAHPAPSPAHAFRSAGEYLKAVVEGNTEARALATGDATLADSDPSPAWIQRAIKTIDARQRITKLFTHTKDLPATGNTIEYPELESETLAVSKQENEGDTLAYGKITLTRGSAPISTYGGYAKLSRQAVERSAAPYLSTLHAAQAARYARTIEAATVALATATIEQQTAESPLEISKAATALTVDDLISIVLDMAAWYADEVDFPLAGLLVSNDVFKHLALLDETPKALSFTGSPEDKQGTITVTGPSANVLSVPVVPISSETSLLSGFASEAIVVQESPGAPFRLSDQDITDLTNVYSVYGYAAHYAPAPSAIVPVSFGA